jgi:signal transduction histidine kinase
MAKSRRPKRRKTPKRRIRPSSRSAPGKARPPRSRGPALRAEIAALREQQAATSEILRVISSSPTEAQPVFDAIASSATRLCDATFCIVFRFDGEMITVAADDGRSPGTLDVIRAAYPSPPGRQSISAQTIRERRVISIADTQNSIEYPHRAERARAIGYRAILSVPMLRGDVAIGAINVARLEAIPFSDAQIELLKTFADQAVIAIENVRLFTELQTSNRELTTALDQQTATSEVLRVISRSRTDVQPVFDAIVANARKLLNGFSAVVSRVVGDELHLGAFTTTGSAGDEALKDSFPRRLSDVPHLGQVVHDMTPVVVTDVETDERYDNIRDVARARGFRSLVTVPLLRESRAIGIINVSRREPGGFSEHEIALLETFADQAVIAIENARLLTELQARTQELTRSVDQLTALGEVGQAVSSSLDLDTVLTTIVGRAVQLAGADGGTLYEYDETAQAFELRATTNADDQVRQLRRTSRLRLGEGAVGIAGQAKEPIQVPDIAIEGAYDSRLREALLRAGTRALLAVPLLREERILGGLVVSRRTPGEFAPEVVSVLKTFATQSALAIQNARLFREIEVKSRQLEVASQHKSEFLANMSHELRTPLNAVIGFSEVLLERMFGEVNDKQAEYLGDILTSAQHLLSLINDILDLSKIEAGRMELDASEFDLPSAIDNALTLVRERAGRRGITLEQTIDARLGQVRADERKIKQVLLNLLSNALKFTPEGGGVNVRAGIVDGLAEISVTDTGVGIAPEDHNAVFEEFRQVGSAEKKSEGTGLGLPLAKKFIELHGGRIWLKSQIGAGSTFTFTLPLKETA